MSRIAVVIPMLVIALPLPGGSQGPVRDSAGVRIVENTRPSWPRGSEWTVLDRPSFDVGSGDDSLYQLLNVMGAVRLQDGRVAVANMSSGSVRIYDASARYVRDIGRTGQAPRSSGRSWGFIAFRAIRSRSTTAAMKWNTSQRTGRMSASCGWLGAGGRSS